MTTSTTTSTTSTNGSITVAATMQGNSQHDRQLATPRSCSQRQYHGVRRGGGDGGHGTFVAGPEEQKQRTLSTSSSYHRQQQQGQPESPSSTSVSSLSCSDSSITMPMTPTSPPQTHTQIPPRPSTSHFIVVEESKMSQLPPLSFTTSKARQSHGGDQQTTNGAKMAMLPKQQRPMPIGHRTQPRSKSYTHGSGKNGAADVNAASSISYRPSRLMHSQRAVSDCSIQVRDALSYLDCHDSDDDGDGYNILTSSQRKRSSVGLPSAYPFCKKLNSSMTTMSTAPTTMMDDLDDDDLDLSYRSSSVATASCVSSPLRNPWLSFEFCTPPRHEAEQESASSYFDRASSFEESSSDERDDDDAATTATRRSSVQRRKRNQALTSIDFNEDILNQLYIS